MIENIWAAVLAVATPIAGLVAFAVHIRKLKNLRLKNDHLEAQLKDVQKRMALHDEKMGLEVEKLKREEKDANRRVRMPTEEQIDKYSIRPRSDQNLDMLLDLKSSGSSINYLRWIIFSIAVIAVAVGLYFLVK